MDPRALSIRSGLVRDWYLGAVIVVSCLGCLIPQLLLAVDVWDRAGVLVLAGLVVSIGGIVVGGRWLPAGYFELRLREHAGSIYERVGVRTFRRVVPDGDIVARIARRSQPPGRGGIRRIDVAALVQRGKLAEGSHLIGLISMLPAVILAIAVERPASVTILAVAAMIFHGYPVLLQRYTRGRLHRVQSRRGFPPTTGAR